MDVIEVAYRMGHWLPVEGWGWLFYGGWFLWLSDKDRKFP